MESSVAIAAISAIAGLATATLGALAKGAVNRRAGLNEDLRSMRLQTYPKVWKLTSALSTWPEQNLTYGELGTLHERLRAWYFGCDEFADEHGQPGGLSLSTTARERYGNVQEIIAIYLGESDDESRRVPSEVYSALRASCSAFRTALTEDLDTRRTRSLWYAHQMRREHAKEAVNAQRRITQARIAAGKTGGEAPHPISAARPGRA
jgi:hypothetical protein